MILVLIPFLLIEGGLRILLRKDAFIDRILYRSTESYSPLWRMCWLNQQSTKPTITYSFDEHDPELGWTLKPNLNRIRAFEAVAKNKFVSSNSFGMRGRREYSLDKPKGVLRIALIGDSYSFGEEVSDDETFAYLIEKSSPNIEVLNFAVHGYGHDQMLLTLKKKVAQFKPDIVLLGYFDADYDRNVMTFRDFAKPRFELQGNQLVLKNCPVPSPEQIIRSEFFKLKIFDFAEILKTWFRWASGKLDKEKENLQQRLLEEIVSETKKMGASLAIVHLPPSNNPLSTAPAPQGLEQTVMNFCKNQLIQCTYLRPYFLAEKKRGITHTISSGHWDATGHKTMANGILDFLKKNDLTHSQD